MRHLEAPSAARMAISSPLLESSIEGATGILLNISGGPDMGLFEVNEAAEVVTGHADPNANVISVASITSTGALSSFSNYGSTTIDIGAPGKISIKPGTIVNTVSGAISTPDDIAKAA